MFVLVVCVLFLLVSFTYAYHVLAQFQHTKGVKGRNVLIVTAHPDDECMFFGPTIAGLQRAKSRVFVLCLSNGDADGKGHVRAHEFTKSCAVLGIPASNIKVMNENELRDGMNTTWSMSTIERLLKPFVHKHRIDTLVTFDDHGVSGHPNHCAVYTGARQFSESSGLPLYRLTSVSLPRKYIGLLDLTAVSTSNIRGQAKDALYVAPPGTYLRIHKAMRQHASQLVWFRWLYVIFSRYMYINELELVH